LKKNSLKYLALILLVILFANCNSQNAANEQPATSIVTTKTTPPNQELQVGGLYVVKDKTNSYYITKILAMDDFAVHLRTYLNEFTTIPSQISSDTLKVLIGHAPIARKGFLIDSPSLIKVEKVKESELEGYKIYLEEMSKE